MDVETKRITFVVACVWGAFHLLGLGLWLHVDYLACLAVSLILDAVGLFVAGAILLSTRIFKKEES